MNFTCNPQIFVLNLVSLDWEAPLLMLARVVLRDQSVAQNKSQFSLKHKNRKVKGARMHRGGCSLILSVLLDSTTLTSIVRVVCFCMFLFSLATFAIQYFNHQHDHQPWYKQSEKMKNLNSQLI